MSDKNQCIAAGSPADTPTTWEDAPAFREIFLMHLPPEVAQAMRQAGRYLYDGALEQAPHEPALPWVEAQVRALLEDLMFTARVFDSLSTTPEDAVIEGKELDLARRASRWAACISTVALGVGAALEGDADHSAGSGDRNDQSREDRPLDGAAMFRETFLCRFADPEDAETVRRFGDLVLSLAVGAGVMETGKSTSAGSELAAVGADVKRIEAYLRQVVEDVEGSEVSTAEAALAERARDWLINAADLAHEITCAVEEVEGRGAGADRQ